VQLDVHHVGVAEEVVQVAERLLVGAHHERGEVVRLGLAQLVHLERALGLAHAGEVVDLAVGVAGDVRQHRVAQRLLVERWIGMIGNSWSIAQLSGSDWNTDTLQK